MRSLLILGWCICCGFTRRVYLSNEREAATKVKVRGSVFTKPHADGDFLWMIESNRYPNALYVFNDNADDHFSGRQGGGNAVVRPFNKHGQKPKPAKSAGVCTGAFGIGFQSLSPDVKKIIDRDIAEIRELLATGNYDLLIYSATKEAPDLLGTGIFQVGSDVRSYIVKQLRQFDNCSPSEMTRALGSSVAPPSQPQIRDPENSLAMHLLTTNSASLGRFGPGVSKAAGSPQRLRRASQMQFPNIFGLGDGGEVVEISDSAPAWDALVESAASTDAGQSLANEVSLREKGGGAAHTDALLRLFDAKSEEDVRVTLYRDDAAWCPYCQKVWMLLEEKRIPFKVSKINMRSYGDKPSWFTSKVAGGLLPVIELDGKVITESLKIMQILDQAFPQGPPMLPGDESGFDKVNELLTLERRLFGAWCSLTFRPGLMGSNEQQFLDVMRKVDDALLATPGPWFLGGDAPSLVDMQYISHVERMIASVLYWKGLKLRGTGEFKGLDAWLAAFEERPTYIATKSDYYTHCMDIPPQYGPAFPDDKAKDFEKAIGGGAWEFPLKLDSADVLEPLSPSQWNGEENARHEAAWKLTRNHKNIVSFAARGAGQRGKKQFQAPLADPYAEPSDKLMTAVDVALRHVTAALLRGTEEVSSAAKADLGSVTRGQDSERLIKCLAYLRDRIGVPRDMGQAAAFYLRAQLNWAIGLLS